MFAIRRGGLDEYCSTSFSKSASMDSRELSTMSVVPRILYVVRSHPVGKSTISPAVKTRCGEGMHGSGDQEMRIVEKSHPLVGAAVAIPLAPTKTMAFGSETSLCCLPAYTAPSQMTRRETGDPGTEEPVGRYGQRRALCVGRRSLASSTIARSA